MQLETVTAVAFADRLSLSTKDTRAGFAAHLVAMAHRRPLNRLPEAVLPAVLVNQLAQIGVVTVGELFHVSPLQVVAYTDLSLGELEKLRADIATKVAQPTATALSLLRDRQSHAENSDRYYISTGLLPLDQSLRGGIPLGSVADICGSPGAGKTQFCLFIAITTILDSPDCSIIYIDAELKVDSNRLLQLLTAQYERRHPAAEPSAEVLDSYLQRIVIRRPSSVDEFQTLLLGVEEDVISLQCPLLVVDSLAALTKRRHMPAQELDRFLLSTAQQLSRIASLCRCGVLVANQVASASHGWEGQIFGDGQLTSATGVAVAPALGAAWYHCVATRLHVKLHVAAWHDEQAVGDDPDTTFVFPNPADAEDVNVSLVPAETRLAARPAGADHQRTLGSVTVIKSPTTPSASHVYTINNAGIFIVES